MVRLFGRLSVSQDERELDGFDVAKVQELFGYLLLHPDHSYSRDNLASKL